MKFCSVDEASARKPPDRVVRPLTDAVPVNTADELMFCPLIRPDVIAVAYRLVVEAEFANIDVVVAPCAVKFCRVDEPLARKLPEVVRPDTVSDPRVPIVVSDERVVTDGVI